MTFREQHLSNNVGASYYPRIVTLNNNVYVVWNDDSIGNLEVMYGRSIDEGASFEGTINLSNTDENSYTSALTATTTRLIG
ncbi:MAG: hypothetical protein WBX01_09220 [Nitrososphaeraceae archaeon]